MSKERLIIASLIAVIIALLVLNCNGRNEADAQIEQLKSQHIKKSEAAIAEARSREAVIAQYRDSVRQAQAAIRNAESRIAELRKADAKKAAQIAQFNAVQVAAAINNRYNSKTAIAVADSVRIPTSTGRQILTNLNTGDTCAEELAITNTIVEHHKKSGKAKDSIITEQDRQKLLLESAVQNQQSAYELQGVQLLGQQQENKKLRRREWLWKLIAPAAAAAGFYAGTKF